MKYNGATTAHYLLKHLIIKLKTLSETKNSDRVLL